jgi:outer membrane protein assembly factor BamB
VLWQDLFDAGGLGGTATAIAAAGGRVYAAGQAGRDFLVRAYDGGTGSVLWQDQHDAAGLSDSATAVVVDGGRVYVAGGVTFEEPHPYYPGRSLAVVRAYDAATGELLWQDLFDQSLKTQTTVATTVAADAGRLYVGGDRDGEFFIRALDGETGSFVWQDISGAGRATGITAQAGLVYAVSEAFVVRAYEAGTGAVVWGDTLDAATGKAVSVGGEHLFVAGVIPSEDGTGLGYDFLVRAYDAATGLLAWQDRLHGVGNRTNIALALDSPADSFGGIRVYVAGFVTSAANNTDYVVQAYDGQSGRLVWSDTFDRAGGLDEAVTIAADSKRVYAAGFVSGNVNGDFFVRAYAGR